jgi:hypothetical protein
MGEFQVGMCVDERRKNGDATKLDHSTPRA